MFASIRALALAALLASAGSAPAQKIRVVSCDAQVQSHKRGISANHLEAADFTALAPGVSWWYSWHFKPDSIMPQGTKMEFLPMVWGNAPESLAGAEAYLAGGARPRRILALNEPNLKGQAFITPEQTSQAFLKVKALGDRYGIPVVGPHMAIGSKPEDSVSAYDPIDQHQTTYTFMVPFLKAFLSYAGSAKVPAIGFHSYGNSGEMRWAIDMMEKEFHKPLWVTEYMHVPNPQEGLSYLIEATDALERSPNVEGYAWFKERAQGADEAFCLLQPEAGKLTALGEAYVQMPVHDSDLYYRIPGKLQAERYVSMQGAEIRATTDRSGLADMFSTAAGGTLEYNLQVDQPGTYEVLVRASGQPGKIAIHQGSTQLASAQNDRSEWHEIRTIIKLAKGPQKLSIEIDAPGVALNWLSFRKL